MKLPVPFVQLPLHFDATRLLAEVNALDQSCWLDHPQKIPGNYSLPLVSVSGDPHTDAIAGPMRPTPSLALCPYLMQVLARLGAVWGRTRLMKLVGRAEVPPHADISYYWRERVRVHVPILTKPSVRFLCGEAEVNMAPGECWIFDTWRQHQVINAADTERIHLVADTIGSDEFAELVRHGRAPGHGAFEGWRAEPMAAQVGPNPVLRYESVNVPVVMTPWEIREHMGFLLAHVHPHPQLDSTRQIVGQFLTQWHALWAEHGVDRAGWPAYREALVAFEASMERHSVSLQLINGALFMNTLRAMILRVALADPGLIGYASDPEKAPPSAPSGSPQGVSPDPVFERPIFIMSPPRAGSTLLFETLARAPGLYTIGHESHALIEGLPVLHPGHRDFDSNRLDAAAATHVLAEELRRRFQAELRDRDGRAPTQWPVRMLEKTPKNALRVPFMAEVFPDAHFIYLHRDPRQTLSSMLEAWQSGRFRTYPQLPGWSGLPWSLILVPHWRELIGRPLPEIVAEQWETTTSILLDDLEAMPAERRHVVQYEALIADPAAEVARLKHELGLEWDRPFAGALPLSRFTVSPPAAEKWKRHADLIDPLLPRLQATIERARHFAGR